MKIFLCEAIHQNAYDELKKYGCELLNRIRKSFSEKIYMK